MNMHGPKISKPANPTMPTPIYIYVIMLILHLALLLGIGLIMSTLMGQINPPGRPNLYVVITATLVIWIGFLLHTGRLG
jgi:hypothetical protein